MMSASARPWAASQRANAFRASSSPRGARGPPTRIVETLAGQRGTERVAKRVRRIGREREDTPAGARLAGGIGSAHVVLPTPPLPPKKWKEGGPLTVSLFLERFDFHA